MQTIYKYPFDIAPEFEIFMPESAEILTVQMQRHRPAIWAKFNPKFEMKSRKFKLVQDKEQIDENLCQMKYIGTFQNDFKEVYHLFEII